MGGGGRGPVAFSVPAGARAFGARWCPCLGALIPDFGFRGPGPAWCPLVPVPFVPAGARALVPSSSQLGTVALVQKHKGEDLDSVWGSHPKNLQSARNSTKTQFQIEFEAFTFWWAQKSPQLHDTTFATSV